MIFDVWEIKLRKKSRILNALFNIPFYRFPDNWHKHPWVSGVLCKFGRHEYEYERMDGPNSAILFCLRCCKRKKSTNLGTNRIWNGK